MKILFIEWASFGNADIKDAFIKEGHEVICFPFSNRDPRCDKEIEADLTKTLHKEAPGAVFSFNYFPVISNVCKKEMLPYVAWVYDSPYVMLYSYTVINPCNFIYVFDKELYLEFRNAGIQTVHYMPMAANTKRLDAMCRNAIPPSASQTKSRQAGHGASSSPDAERARFRYDISFVGSLYTEDHNFFDRMNHLPEYTKGYLDGLMNAQIKVQGYNFIQESLSPILEDLYKALPMEPNPDGVETKEYLYAQYVINRKITGIERDELIKAVTKKHTLDLFTIDASYQQPNLNNHGTVDYYTAMPLVFSQSRINLNISLRSIKSGIPLRAFDIMGSGGFLLSNFQNDFLEYFTPGEDFVYYESKEDLLQKIDYYLQHEDERIAIAANGHAKTAAAHTYRHRVREMFT